MTKEQIEKEIAIYEDNIKSITDLMKSYGTSQRMIDNSILVKKYKEHIKKLQKMLK